MSYFDFPSLLLCQGFIKAAQMFLVTNHPEAKRGLSYSSGRGMYFCPKSPYLNHSGLRSFFYLDILIVYPSDNVICYSLSYVHKCIVQIRRSSKNESISLSLHTLYLHGDFHLGITSKNSAFQSCDHWTIVEYWSFSSSSSVLEKDDKSFLDVSETFFLLINFEKANRFVP